MIWRHTLLRWTVATLAVAMLAGCAPKEPKLLRAAAVSTGEGPDEFAITTNKPLEEPQSYATLVPPTTNEPNRADIVPQDDAIVALGGRPLRDGGIARATPLMAYASRYGYDPDIRERLAAEDLEFRRRNRGKLMERIFAVNVYFDAYRPMSLDQHAELLRLRALGIRTPAAPPDPR